ncbi:BTAD domain-containing putative transcriptional regulator [Amycolatopsis magusensis]|uniref:AfsR/SARP family transcriptional regulator n=1 Tax=Amycolatopsis magusensis TaxID=882444 RepID=UPI003C2E52E7
MRFRALGPLEFLDATEWRAIRAPKWRLLLATLLIEAGQVLSVDRIAAELWDEAQPKTVGNQVHGYVSRLRRLLRDGQGELLVTQAPGYRLRIEPADTDFGRFFALVDSGRAAWRAGDTDEAAGLLSGGLALWRGNAFQDVPVSPLVRAEADNLNELRVTVLEDLAEVNLLRGQHGELSAELAELVKEHPLRERMRELQMLALYRNGRQADALTAYADLRERLADELGVDPSPPLQRLYERILRADGALASPAQPAAQPEKEPPPGPDLPVHQLPPDVPDFTDRRAKREAIAGVIASRKETGPPPVAVVAGGPGVGKSTLAVHVAHAAKPHFPDGQFYLDLAGTSADPRDPAVLLAEVLHALGITGAWIPEGLPARTTLYRSLLARRRMLLVLDDAANADQVRPLLPSTGSCAVLVTSRTQMNDLPGARHIELDVFRPQEARELFASIVSAERVAAEPEEAEKILRSCGYLPLAIRISGGRLAGRTTWPLRVMRERLADESKRLGELRVGELDVRASFGLSLRSLPPIAVQAFGLLGLLGRESLPGWVLGPLLDRQDAHDVLDMLVDASLVQLADTDAVGQPRYRLHDLLRTYALETAETFPAATRHAALTRLLATWLDLVEQAVDRLPPSLFRPKPGLTVRRPLPPGTVAQLVANPLAWFSAERVCLLGAVKLAAEGEMDELAWELAAHTACYYDVHNQHEDWRQSHQLVLKVVHEAGNKPGEAAMLRGLAQVQIYRDALTDATESLRESLRLCQEIGDRRGEALAASALGTVERSQGHHDQALEHVRHALELVVETGDRAIEAQLRNGIATIHLAQGRPAEAEPWFEEALRLARELGDVHREAVVLREMSQLHRESGATAHALRSLRRALDIFEELNDERCRAYTLVKLGRLYAERGERAQTSLALESAARMYARSGDRMAEAASWQLLGELAATQHNADTARVHLNVALRLWQDFGADDQVNELKSKLHRLPH